MALKQVADYGAETVKMEVASSNHNEEKNMSGKDKQKLVPSVMFAADYEALKDEKKRCKAVELNDKKLIQNVGKDTTFTEKQIRAMFNRLRLFLKEEEESRLAALKEGEDQKKEVVMRELKNWWNVSSPCSICAVIEEVEQWPQ